MIEEPYRWLEAVENRREYVRDQIKEGSPAFAVCLKDGILLLGVGTGNSKVFEIFDRHGLVGLGHPADIEKLRQTAIDSAHMEAFIRAPEDVGLRRLVSFTLGPQLKTSFEQIFGAPYLIELLLAEIGSTPENDLLARVHFDGRFELQTGGAAAVASQPETERTATEWIAKRIESSANRKDAAEILLQAWWCVTEKKPFPDDTTTSEDVRTGWRERVAGKTVEIGWLARTGKGRTRFESLSLPQLGL
ncbi:MAG: hypothetical protein O2960_20245 [Verrucomicrobia bacterium]|nr:hypothetical protein [Verrucomicrobiota bacterium]